MSLFKKALFSCVIFTSSLMALSTGMGKYTFSRMEIKHREHKGMGFNEGYSTIGVFTCPNVNTIGLPFFDAKLHVFNNAYLASNIGIGCRFSNPQETFIFGLNAYYDYRNLKSFSTHQGSAGLELLGRSWSLRLNGYLPFSGKFQEDDIFFHSFQGNSALVGQKIRYSLPSADGEIGLNLPAPFEQLGLYIGAGGYYLFKQRGFFGFQSAGNILGGRARIKASPTDWFSIGVEYTYDKLFKGRVNGYAAFNIPLGPRKLQGSTKNRFPYIKSESDQFLEWMKIRTQDVIRNEIVPIYTKNHRFPHLNEAGEDYFFVFVNNTGTAHIGQGTDIGTGDGSFENPYTTLRLADVNAPEDAVVYVFFGDGTSRNYDEGYGFKSGQVVSSSGADLPLNGVIVPAFTPNEYAKVTNKDAAVFRAVSSRAVTINGFQIEADGGVAVDIDGTAVTLRRNLVKGATGFNAVSIINPVGNTYVTENDLTSGGAGTGSAVVSLENNSSNVASNFTFNSNTVEAKDGEDALQIFNQYGSSYIYGNTFSSNALQGSGIDVSADSGNTSQTASYIIHNNTFKEGFGYGVLASWDASSSNFVKVRDNKFLDTSLAIGTFYQNSSANGNLIVTGNTINTQAEGVIAFNKTNVSGAKGTATITGNTININGGSSGILTETTGAFNWDIEQNTITYNGSYGGDYSGIHYENDSVGNITQNSLFVSKNSVNMNNNSVFDINVKNGDSISDGSSVLTATIDSNSCRAIQVTQNGAQPLCLTLTRNIVPEVFNLAVTGGAKGSFGVFSQSSSELNVNGLKKGPGKPNGNNPSSSAEYTVQAEFAPPGSGCPQVQAIYVNNNSTSTLSTGSYWNPYTNLEAASENADRDDLVIIYGSQGGTPYPLSQSFNLKGGQVILGSSTSYDYKGITIQPENSYKPIIHSPLTGSSAGIVFQGDGFGGLYTVGGLQLEQGITLGTGGTYPLISLTLQLEALISANIFQNDLALDASIDGASAVTIHTVLEPSEDYVINIADNNVTSAGTSRCNGFVVDIGTGDGTINVERNSVISVYDGAVSIETGNNNNDVVVNINDNTVKSFSTVANSIVTANVRSVNGTININNNTCLYAHDCFGVSFGEALGTPNYVCNFHNNVCSGDDFGLELSNNSAQTASALDVKISNNKFIRGTATLPPSLAVGSSEAVTCVNELKGNDIRSYIFQVAQSGAEIKIATGSEANLKNTNNKNATVTYLPKEAENTQITYIPEGSSCP